MPAPPPPFHVSRDRPLSPPLSSSSSYASAVLRGIHTPPQLHRQEESGSESELDSPIRTPRIVFITAKDQEPGSPTSPPGSPPSVDVNPAGSTFRSNTEEWHSTDGEDNPYFKSLVDNFITAAADVSKPTLPEDDIDYKAIHQRQSNLYAEGALKHYNNDEKNKVKYELISAITSCGGIMDAKGCYGHVNFTAKGNQQNSKEELFFAELREDDDDTIVPTCVLSLKGKKKVGGLCDSVYDKFHGIGLPIDAEHCYACDGGLKHPKDGTLYETGHVACSDYYHG